jgi:chromosome segregation ATPase
MAFELHLHDLYQKTHLPTHDLGYKADRVKATVGGRDLYLGSDTVNRRLVTEYEAVIRVMKEQISILKRQVGFADESLRKFKLNEYAELQNDLKEVRTALSIAREDSRLKDLTIKQHEAELTDLTTALRSYEDYQERLEGEAERWKRMASCNDETKSPFESVSGYSPVQSRLAREPSTEKLQAANRRFRSLLKKLDKSQQARLQLEERNKQLEADRKKLVLKWQSSAQRYKADDRVKAKLKHLETAVADKHREKADLDEQLRGTLAELSELRVQKAELIARKDEAIRRMLMQRQLDEEEKVVLKRMSQELKYRSQLQQIELTHYKQDAYQLRGLLERYQATAERPSDADQELLDGQRSQSLSGILKGLVSETERPILSVIPQKRPATPHRTKSMMEGGNMNHSSSQIHLIQMQRSSRTPPPKKQRYSPRVVGQ